MKKNTKATKTKKTTKKGRHSIPGGAVVGLVAGLAAAAPGGGGATLGLLGA